jgi:hypothetical protein
MKRLNISIYTFSLFLVGNFCPRCIRLQHVMLEIETNALAVKMMSYNTKHRVFIPRYFFIKF